VATRSTLRILRREALLAGLALALPRLARAETAEDGEANRVARWLGGVEALPGTPPDEEWVAYAMGESERWGRQEPRLRAMQAWARRELASAVSWDRPVVYPFAGPDALHALALFGGAERVVLVGLEPVGDLPGATASAAAGYFRHLGAALEDVHKLTFFRTHAMASAFARVGVFPALLGTVARVGGRVTSFRSTDTPRGVRIDWVGEDERARQLEYVELDLANAGLAHQPAFLARLRRMAPYVTFLKAASYLLWEPRFSRARRMILEDSAVIVEDDAGLPFRDLTGRDWTLRLFGRYETPVSPFEDRWQPDLEAAYASRGGRPLPFGIGYHVDAARSNLLVAAKVGA
jgi:hypothetical protein